jgi:hypothetical protein
VAAQHPRLPHRHVVLEVGLAMLDRCEQAAAAAVHEQLRLF